MDEAAILESRRVEIIHIRPRAQQQEVADDEEGLSEIAEEGSASAEEGAAAEEETRVWERRGAMSAQGGASAEAVARQEVAPARSRRAGHWHQRVWGVLTQTL